MTGLLINEHEFTAVKKKPARVGQAMLEGIRTDQARFVRTRRPGESQPIGPVDLLRQIGAFPLQTRGEMFALPQNKRVVERGQSLKRGERAIAFGREQIRIGAIE